MVLEVSWDGIWTPSFELSQFHGHNSWIVWEVALMLISVGDIRHNKQGICLLFEVFACWLHDA